ncbi:MAG: hypothetical protein ACI9EF_000496 [Pseudohongiellaceae bacterium]|jgi:hypothetical protein
MPTTPQQPARFGPRKSLLSIALLGAMAGMVFPGANAYVSHSRNELATQEMLSISETFQQLRKDTKTWPGTRGSASVATQKSELSAYPSLAANEIGAPPIDPWGNPYIVCSFARGYDDTRGGLMMLSSGPDGLVQSDDKQIFNTRPSGDDLTQLITFNLR